MELFLDNDIILKLAAAGLLQEIEKLFNVSPDSIFILPSAIDYISKSGSVRRNNSQANIKSAIEIIKKYKPIPDEYMDESKNIRLFDIDGIDSGEQILFSLTPKSSEFLILTGDKIAIIRLNNSKDLDDIINSLNGKIVCLEFIIIQILNENIFEIIARKIIDSNYCNDTTLQICFSQNELTFKEVSEGLISYFNDLKSQSGSLLLLIE